MALITCWLVSSRWWATEPGTIVERSGKTVSHKPIQPGLPISPPQIPSTNTGLEAGTKTTNVAGERVANSVALEALKRWIKRREGKAVEILSSQVVNDLDGKPASLNVLVTTRLGGRMSAESLKAQLDANSLRERLLREQLQHAYQETNIAGVNKLVAELADARAAFVATNEITSYKVSLSKERPPVLAFWPGLPFETVREDAARNLAATRLGNSIGLQGLVHYTSATALLCFTNSAGTPIYIDPFRIAEVQYSTLQAPRGRTARADDGGRESRVATQWEDFLQP